ncbi:MAG: alpha/beta hydrolase [Alcanivoracaceae bacterium]|nr:alpha/beta hydrolase [Alcanivoracaceae bacterium]
MSRVAEEKTFDGWGLTLAARYWPGKGMPIVALHGWLDNANSFVPFAQHVPNPILAMDFAGHGLSAHRPDGAATHFLDHVRDVLALLDDAGIGKCILLGHSMGAGIASLFAATFPERVEKLVLVEGIGPMSGEPAESPQQLRRSIDETQALAGKQKPCYAKFNDAVTARTRGFGGLSEACSALLCERGLVQMEQGWTWRSDARLCIASSLRMTEPQVEAFLRAIQAPTLLVVGEQGMGGNGMFDHRTHWIASLQVVRLPGRHHLHMESPQPVANSINEFIAVTAGS